MMFAALRCQIFWHDRISPRISHGPATGFALQQLKHLTTQYFCKQFPMAYMHTAQVQCKWATNILQHQHCELELQMEPFTNTALDISKLSTPGPISAFNEHCNLAGSKRQRCHAFQDATKSSGVALSTVVWHSKKVKKGKPPTFNKAISQQSDPMACCSFRLWPLRWY